METEQRRKTKPVAGNDRDNPYDRDDLRYGNQAFNSKDANVEAHANGDNKSQHCCLLLGVFGKQCCARLHGPKSLSVFKLCAASANIVVVPCKQTQHIRPNNGKTYLFNLHKFITNYLNTNFPTIPQSAPTKG